MDDVPGWDAASAAVVTPDFDAGGVLIIDNDAQFRGIQWMGWSRTMNVGFIGVSKRRSTKRQSQQQTL